MKEPRFLHLDDILEIHHDQIEKYGGHSGIRDIGLLQSAIEMPASGFGEEYHHADIYEMALAYLFHIIQNHPFIDENKRTGAVATIVFLILNGVELHADEEEFEKIVLAVAEGKGAKEKISTFLKKHSS